ncbi:hypothetical protein [Actinomadura rudentiformis]|uniref:Uncharacterized protein n=1 Tax=Actinomadura rudentiformis TaxID=359158 RepID=A0A6H9YXF0_9ACTN|nr:hypothetical protein [Actinomadura rudentiformis]KAB2344852.1 hypothetical protein F8566_30130 [Actinomadura rudentiformis]
MRELATERVATPDLRGGDLVLHYGMRVRIPAEPRTWRRKDMTVYGWDGQIENLDEVLTAGLVPHAFLREEVWMDGEGWVCRTTDRWVIQGNELAMWTRLLAPGADHDGS